MLKDRKCAATIPAADMDRAMAWYRDKLGLEPADKSPAGARYECADGTLFELYPSQFAGTGQHTVMGWESPDFDKDMEELRSGGVTFEEYDFPGLKTENGVAEMEGERACWFKDSEGNILSLGQHTG
jgi:catechol 2,3-dioxygenase-like lactoylglutathione lyase family enzyme